MCLKPDDTIRLDQRFRFDNLLLQDNAAVQTGQDAITDAERCGFQILLETP